MKGEWEDDSKTYSNKVETRPKPWLSTGMSKCYTTQSDRHYLLSGSKEMSTIFDGYELGDIIQLYNYVSVARHTLDTNNNMGAPAIWRVLLISRSPLSVAPLHCTMHCPIQSDCSSDCQGGGHVSQSSSHYNIGVGSICEGGHKLKVFTSYSCNSIAVQPAPNGCSTCELDTSSGRKKWLNYPVQLKSLVDSAGVSHHLSRTGPSHTHTGVQDNTSCMQDNIAMQ